MTTSVDTNFRPPTREECLDAAAEVIARVWAQQQGRRLRPSSVQTPWLTILEAAEYMRLGKRTIEHLVAAEQLASSVVETKIGSRNPRRLIHRDDCDNYLRARRHDTNVRY